MGTVIDKKMLNHIAPKFYGLAAAVVPLGLAYSTFAARKSDVLRPCDALTPEQVGSPALVAKLCAVCC